VEAALDFYAEGESEVRGRSVVECGKGLNTGFRNRLWRRESLESAILIATLLPLWARSVGSAPASRRSVIKTEFRKLQQYNEVWPVVSNASTAAPRSSRNLAISTFPQ
jgi:hypothetical protein